VAPRGQKVDGPSGCGRVVRVLFKLLLELFDNLLPVLSLPFRLTGIVAEDVAASELAIADYYFFGMQVLRDDLEAPGLCEDLLLYFRYAPMRVARRYFPQALASSCRFS